MDSTERPGPHADPACALTPREIPSGHICPLFWQHGEDPAILREELRAMRSAGIRQCILESRPHPDWLGPGWWASLDAIMGEAAALGMRVWVFDDGAYPSGRAGTLMRDRHPGLCKVYLARREIEAAGPLASATFLVGAWEEGGDSAVAVVAGRRPDPRRDAIDPASLVDLTARVRDGRLRWDVPAGAWRLYVLVRTRNGGEEWTRDHLNPLLPEAGRAFIAEVHEAHWARYRSLFGTTFAGFFTDEPRFGNKPVYDAVLGVSDQVIPWSDDLLAELDARWGGPFTPVLPALWHDAGEVSRRARSLYMDVVSARFARNFTGAIGDWCRERGVQLIGHVVEDNGAHARLGHGAGHLFRALQGQDMGGLDFVYQAWPRFPAGRIDTPFGPWDLDFFRWGLAKLASSAAHVDPRKEGRTMAELFGAYGWQLGLRDMKWLTDVACARGVNFLVPHAFSPRFPDPDCPPHFFARGENPQWRLFPAWSAYAERLCHLFSDGVHEAPVAVLYHAEAEWAGAAEPSEAAVRELALRQVDCDIVPADALLDPSLTSAADGVLQVHGERFRALVVPFAERLPARLLRLLPRLADAGVTVAFTRGAPAGASDADLAAAELAAITAHPRALVVTTEGLPAALAARGIRGIPAQPGAPHLRTYRWRRAGMDLVFCANEDPALAVDSWLSIGDPRAPVGYDAMADAVVPVEWRRDDAGVSVRVRIEPYGSLVLAFADDAPAFTVGHEALPSAGDLVTVRGVAGPWTAATSEARGYPAWTPRPGAVTPGDASALPGLEEFGGTIAYETMVELPGGRAWLDLGAVGETSEAWMDGRPLGTRICPPHLYALPPGTGWHALRVEVTTTLARRLGANVFDRAMAQEPTGLVGPVRILGRRGSQAAG